MLSYGEVIWSTFPIVRDHSHTVSAMSGPPSIAFLKIIVSYLSVIRLSSLCEPNVRS